MVTYTIQGDAHNIALLILISISMFEAAVTRASVGYVVANLLILNIER